MIKGLVRLSSNLDARGYAKEASMLDSVIQKMAQDKSVEKSASALLADSTPDPCPKEDEMWDPETAQCEKLKPAQEAAKTPIQEVPEKVEMFASSPTPNIDPQNKTDDLWSAASTREPNIVKRGGW